MANETHEPRALTAALAAPAFRTRGGGMAMHVADRHVERWAPESNTNRQRSMRSLGFVDRLVAPWIETAQRSASLRLFSQYARSGVAEREGGAVSWVFPRPWYQDELDWMAAARQVGATSSAEQAPAPTMLTTRGTYVPPSRPSMTTQPAMPSALYEYVAPSLSIATPTQSIAGIGYGGSDAVSRNDAYSPLVSLAAVQAAELMARTVAPMWSTPGANATGSAATGGRISPALRSVLTTMLERAATRTAATEVGPTRSSLYAPELVTPPAPRPQGTETSASAQTAFGGDVAADGQSASQLADRYAEQRTKIVELQRITRQSAEREIVAREIASREIASRESAARESAARETAAVRTETPAVRVEERAAALRAETELRQRATDRATMTEAQQRQAQVERTAAAEVERARIEEKIAQRIAERASSQRLHEQSRTDAATHARAAASEQPVVEQPAAATASEVTVRRAPAEVTAAIAALPPELAAFLAHRPERAMQAITELNDVLRTAELLARSSASNVPFEATRGPRLMMPAGLGGLVAAVDRAQAIAGRPAQLAGQLPTAQPMIASQPSQPRAAVRGDARVPTLPWLVAPTSARAASPSTALGATASTAPAALSHVAWADRWLARFAGATPQSLDVLQAASAGSPQVRMQALAAAAPSEVFVAPIFDIETARAQRTMPVEALAATETGTMPTRTAAPAMPALVRYDDSAETPDDVFLQIAASAATKRAPSSPLPSAASTPSAQTFGTDRYSMADAVAHAAPTAPGAGLSAQLASSPFASALRHVLPLPSAGSFDVRSLFGAGLSATYLAGLLAPASQEFEIAGATTPAWASWGAADAIAAPFEREAPTWDATYVSPEADATRDEIAAHSTQSETVSPPAIAEAARAAEPLTTLRTALLSWTTSGDAGGQPAFLDAPSTITMGSPTAAITSTAARAMLESMSLPMLSESSATAGERTASWTSPGMMAERAQGWSVAQERSASDLSLDFVTPELVLAARVYGLGPTEAAQAARLAIAGPSHLGAMAGAVDRTFVQAMAIEADRREARASGQGPGQGETTSTSAPSSASRAAAITTAYPISATGEIAAAVDTQAPMRPYVAPGAAFGVERRSPRGAFLWPSATVAALGLSAASPDGQQSMSVAALELLAAQAVAEIGTYAALGEHPLEAAGREDSGSNLGSASSTSTPGERPTFAMPTLGATGSSRTAAGEVAAAEPAEADVLGAAAALVPASRRARFDALYVAMSQSPAGRSWSPASRAARALALAGRGDEAPTSAYERAATAWDVLPVVYATDGMSLSAAESTETGTVSTGSSMYASGAARGSARHSGSAGSPGAPGSGGAMSFVEPMISVDRPGLGALSARAGEALGSYVTPASYAPAATASMGSSGSASTRNDVQSQSPAMRAPSAAQELVRTGRPSGRHGGGEVEIPVWFEQAARKMLEDRSGNSDGISMAEMTLVNAAPASHVAASTRTAPSAAPISPANASSREPAGEPIDIEKTANDIYREILVLMDAARARNGEPYL